MAELVISGFIDDQLLRAGRRWPDIVDIYFVRLQFVLQKVVPLEDPVLVAVHEAGAGLYIEPRVLFLDGLKLACGVDDDVPASRLLTDRVEVFLQAVDAKGDRHVQVRTFVQDACDVGNDPLLDLAVRHQVDRFQLVVLVESSRDFGKVLSCKRFAARNDQNAEIGSKRFADARHLRRGHLEFFARFVVQFIREETMNAAHIADGRPVAIRAYRFRISLWWKSIQLEASSIAGLLVAGDRLGFWSVVALFGMPGDLSQTLWRIHFDPDFSVASIELGIRGCVADRVIVPQIVSDVLYKLLHLVEILRKERLAAGDLREFLEVIL